MSAATATEAHVYLLAHTPFKQFIDFMSSEPVDAQTADMRPIADEWRAANRWIKKLAHSEAKWADDPPVGPLSEAVKPLAAQVLADPIFERAFSYVPVELGMVELDRLVVRQKTINLAHVQRLKERLGQSPPPDQVFRLCLPFDHPTVAHRVRSVSDDSFVFNSDSNDLRFLDSIVLRPDQIRDYKAHGPIAGVVGLVVGYGSNYLNAISAEGRLVLNNGSHRSYALRDVGVTHVPCVIQKVGSREELDVVGAGALRRNPELYLQRPRPPVLKDYFDPKLRKIVDLPAAARQVRVSFSVETIDVPGSR